MTLDLADHIQREIYLGAYEQRETAVLQRLLRRGDVVVDVGANVGYFTALAARCVGTAGRVVAVEPSPYAYGRLDEMIGRNGLTQCIAVNCAAGEAVGELPLYYTPAARNHTPTLVDCGGAEVLATVPVRRLDDLLREHTSGRIRVLKIDVEGFELHVLKGAGDRLPDVEFILCELNEPWLIRAGASADALEGFLASAGFIREGAYLSPDMALFRRSASS